MEFKIDTYNYKARVLPVYLTLAPIVLLICSIAPEGLSLPLGGASALVFFPISYLLSQVGADYGKKLEKRLWLSWGGPPTTRFLRNGNQEFNEITRNRIHDKLKASGLHVPALEEQEMDLNRADKYFESCTEELIRWTRDKVKFPLVFKSLTEYGFRRNLLGLKSYGVVFTIAGLAGTVCSTFRSWSLHDQFPAVPIVAGLISAGLLLVWVIWITESAVKLAANRYARFLLEAALDKE